MSQLQIVCQNCGAKYRLPESFSGDRAKCKACGSVIDVAAQRDGDAAAAPSAARPAGARPAAARPAAARPAAARPAGARASARKKEDDGDAPRSSSARRSGARASGARGRKAETEEAKGSNQTALFGGIGALVVVILVAVFGFGGDDKTDEGGEGKDPKKTETASDANSSGDSNTGNANEASTNSGDTGTTGGTTTPEKPADAGTSKPADKPADKPKNKPKRNPKDPVTEETLFDPRTDTSEVTWPDAIEASAREEAEGWVEDIEFAGFAGIRAKKSLRANPYRAVFAVINKMRTLDLRDGDQTRYAAELSRMLQDDLTGGTNVPFTDVDPGEAVDLEIAHKNGKCVEAWVKWADRASQSGNFLESQEAFKKYLEEKAKKKASQGK